MLLDTCCGSPRRKEEGAKGVVEGMEMGMAIMNMR